jgi:predicted transposase YdaD
MWESSIYRSIFAEGQAKAAAENSQWERRTIINLLRRGLDPEVIAEAMEMSIEEVKKIQLREPLLEASTLRDSSVYRAIFAEGFTKGFPEGFARGLAQANAEAEFKGAERRDRTTAIALLRHKMDIKTIAEVTGLRIETIEALRNGAESSQEQT